MKDSDANIIGIKHIYEKDYYTTVEFVDGGIGHTFVKVSIESARGFPINSTFLFYKNATMTSFPTVVFQNEPIFQNETEMVIDSDEEGIEFHTTSIWGSFNGMPRCVWMVLIDPLNSTTEEATFANFTYKTVD